MKLPEDIWGEIAWHTTYKEFVSLGVYIRWLCDYAYCEGKYEMEANPNILFGVVMKSLNGFVTPDNWEELANKVYIWSQKMAETTNAVPEEEEPRQEDIGYISEKQNRRLWAIAKGNHFTDDGVHRLLATFSIESTREIPWQKYDTICKILERENEANTWNQVAVSG